MSTPLDWIVGYARQADADFRAWELYEKYPEAVAGECHKLLLLQMACEKLCKAHLISNNSPPQDLQDSHGYIAGPLPVVIRHQIIIMRKNLRGMEGVIQQVRHLANEMEVLNPAVSRGGTRPDNCEYPWDDAGGTLHSPLDWSFHPSRLLTVPAGRTFLKILRAAINRLLEIDKL
jgi:hypothetical protein